MKTPHMKPLILPGMTVLRRDVLPTIGALEDAAMTVKGIKRYEDGKTRCRCRHVHSQKILTCMEEELVNCDLLPASNFSAAYHTMENIYKAALIREIKAAIRSLIPEGPGSVDLLEAFEESFFDYICKYETPKDYPANYRLSRFGIDRSGKFFAEGDDVDDSDREYTFSEYDFTTEELEIILDIIGQVPDDIRKGFLRLDGDGKVRPAVYRHLGYYNDTEDLRAFIGKDPEDIVAAAQKGEGKFYRCSDDNGKTVSDLEYEYNEGKHRRPDGNQSWSVVRGGRYIVLNGVEELDDPVSELGEDDPDSGVFIDIYELEED